MKLTGIILLFTFYLTHFCDSHDVTKEYAYEFGENYGTQIYNYDGHIPLLHPTTKKTINVPPGFVVTYVKVTVRALSPPVVKFSPSENYVTIDYSWKQITFSYYSILVKGIPGS